MNLFRKINLILSKENRLSIYLLFFLMIIVMVMEIIGLGLMIPALSVVVDPNIIGKYLENDLFDFIIFNKNKAAIILFSCLVIIFLMKTLVILLINWKQAKVMFEINTRIAKYFYKNYLSMNYDFHLKNNSSKMIRNISTETAIVTTLINSICLLAAEITVLIGITFFLFIFNPLGSLLATALLLTLGILIHISVREKLTNWGNIRKRHEKLRVQNLLQGLRGIKEIIVSNYQERFVDIYDKHHKGVFNINMYRNILLPIPRLVFEFGGVLTLSLLVLIGMYFGKSSSEVITIIGVFAVAAVRLLPSYNRITTNSQHVIASIPALDALTEDYIEFQNQEKTDILNNSESNLENLKFKNQITLHNVSFAYPDAPSSAVSDVSLKIHKGSKIAIAGTSGCGKTTLIDIILGLIKPQKGQIIVDDSNIFTCLKAWQKNIGYVPQKIYLTDESIKQNIAFGVPKDQIDNEKIQKVLEISQLSDFIHTLKDGPNTLVGEDGVKLSGGQRQRIGIARALYKNPPILIFDEATNALDNETEKRFLNKLTSNEAEKTIIMVTHRHNTIKNFDEIFLLENGRIKSKKNFEVKINERNYQNIN